MRSLILLLLLLPSSLLAQVKVLFPVVAKDATGKAVTDLKQSDFTVTDTKNFRLTDASLIPPAPISNTDSRPSVVVIYDATNIATTTFDQNLHDMRDFLADIARRKLPVTLLLNTANGLRLIHNARTSPEVLASALAASVPGKSAPADAAGDPQVAAEANNLRLLETTVRPVRTRYNSSVDQMNSLIAFAHLVQQIPGRKALVWVTASAPVGATDNPAYWNATNSFMSDKVLLPMYEAMTEELNVAHVSVYPFYFFRGNVQTVGAAWGVWTGLTQLAESTGGQPLRLGQQTSLAAALDATLNDFGSYYQLTFEVPPPKELDWVSVKIKVIRPGVTIRAATGYLSLKPVKTHDAAGTDSNVPNPK